MINFDLQDAIDGLVDSLAEVQRTLPHGDRDLSPEAIGTAIPECLDAARAFIRTAEGLLG